MGTELLKWNAGVGVTQEEYLLAMVQESAFFWGLMSVEKEKKTWPWQMQVYWLKEREAYAEYRMTL